MDSYILVLSILVPLLCGGTLLLLGNYLGSASNMVALSGFAAPFIIAVYVCVSFDPNVNGFDFQYLEDLGLGFLGIHLHLGVNGISMPLFLMAGIVGLAAGLYAMRAHAERKSLYLALLLIMHAGLMGVFCSVDIFFMYFFHELALIPTFIMMGIWGGSGRRVAAMEMTVYLTLGAMLSLIGLIALYANSDAQTFDLILLQETLKSSSLSELFQNNVFGLLLFGFGILVSLFPFHSWAPRGYANAPSSTAMLHAGVLKKFGLYGLIQVAVPLLPEGLVVWSDWVIWLALGNIVIIGFITMAQRDLKMMLGYSSVMHMGYAFLGIATLSVVGVGGAVLMMVAHGLSVALLFMLATSIQHRTNTYDMDEMGGLGEKAPVLAALFVAATMAGIGLPGFANFWGEFAIFVSLWELAPWILFVAATGIVISAIYGLRAVAKVFYGKSSDELEEFWKDTPPSDIGWGERIPALLLIGAMLLIGIFPSFISNPVNDALLAREASVVEPANVTAASSSSISEK